MLSNIKARAGTLFFILGGGIFIIISSKSSGTPLPVFALIIIISFSLQPIKSIICCFIDSISTPTKSILFITGIISKSFSIAKYAFVTVCASTPCDASTNKTAPSQAAKLLDTS